MAPAMAPIGTDITDDYRKGKAQQQRNMGNPGEYTRGVEGAHQRDDASKQRGKQERCKHTIHKKESYILTVVAAKKGYIVH